MYAIVKKELQNLLKSSKSFIAQALFLLILSLAVWVVWPRVPDSITVKSQIAIEFFKLGGVAIFILVSLLIPVFCAPAITQEKESHCFEIVLTSPIKPFAFLMGKLISYVFYLGLMLLYSVPVVSLCFMLGGIEPVHVFNLYLLILLWIVTFAQIALFFSSIFSKTYASLTISYLVIIPVASVWAFFLLKNYEIATHVTSYLVILGACNLLLFFLSLAVLKKNVFLRDMEKDTENVLDAVFVLDPKAFPDKLLAPVKPPEIPDKINPVYWKEVYCEILGQGTVILRSLILISFIISLPAAFLMFLVDEAIYAIFLITATLLITPSLGGASFTHERENETYDLLLTTPLSFHTIFWGKARSVVRLSLLIIGLLFIPILIGCMSGRISFIPVIKYAFLSMSLTVFVAMLSLLISAWSPSTLYSMILNYVIVFGLFILPVLFFLLLMLIPELSQPAFLNRCGVLAVLSPYAAVLKIRPFTFLSNAAQYLWPVGYTVAIYLVFSCLVIPCAKFVSRSNS